MLKSAYFGVYQLLNR